MMTNTDVAKKRTRRQNFFRRDERPLKDIITDVVRELTDEDIKQFGMNASTLATLVADRVVRRKFKKPEQTYGNGKGGSLQRINTMYMETFSLAKNLLTEEGI